MPTNETKLEVEPKTEYIVTIIAVTKDVPYTADVWKKLVDQPDSKHEEIYGYVTSNLTSDVTTELYKQTLTDIDLKNVIKAVNGIGVDNEQK